MARIREHLQQVIGHFDKLEAALFTTFNFDPEFFEENVLPILFGVSETNPRIVRRQAVHKRLSKVPVGVCFDASVARAGVDDYRYTAYPIRLSNAFFHPKNIILVGQREGKRWLYVSAASSNLTLAGWGLNVEGFADVWVHAKSQQPWQAIDQFLHWIASHLKLGNNKGHLIAQIRNLIDSMHERRTGARDPDERDWKELDDHFLYFSFLKGKEGNLITQEIAGTIAERYGKYGEPQHICAASPYWSNVPANLKPFRAPSWELIPALTQKRDRTGLASEEVGELKKLDIKKIELNRWVDEGDDRFRHAKILRIEYPHRIVVTGIGSCNFTNAGLRKNGNVESMLFSTSRVELPARIKLEERKYADEATLEEEAPKPPAWSIQVLYDWKTRQCRWRVDVGSPPHGARLEVDGLGSYPLDGVTEGEAAWQKGPRKGRSFRVSWEQDGGRHSWPGWILELNLDQATKVYGSPLDPSDILESWRDGGKADPPAPRGPNGQRDDENLPEIEAAHTSLNLFEFYRSVHELEETLRKGLSVQLQVHNMLVTNCNSVFALANAIVNGSESVPVRYLVLKEADRLFADFRHAEGQERRLGHEHQIHEWFLHACDEVLEMLGRECRGQSANKLLEWIDQKLDKWEDP